MLEIVATGGKGVDGIRIESDGQGETVFPCAGVFIFIGLEPNTGFLPADLARDGAGALVTSEDGATALPNVWAIGAVRSGFGGMLTDAAEDAEQVAARLK